PLQAMLVFEALGLGLALPFLLISFFPQLLRFLPKPGAWMNTFKEILAFPMYASVIWLLWVLDLQTGASGIAIALSGMLTIAVILWIRPLFKEGKYRPAAFILFVLMLLITLPMLSRMEISGGMMPPDKMMHEIDTVEFSMEKLAELRAAGKPVFVDA